MNKIFINKNEYDVKNPLDIIRAFWVFDSSFLDYDREPIDNYLTDNSSIDKLIKISRNIGVRASGDVLLKTITAEKENINKYLKMISDMQNKKEQELLDISEEKWQLLKINIIKIIKYLANNDGISVSTSTKILHKLNPAIFPILDVASVQSLYDIEIEKSKVGNKSEINEEKLGELLESIRYDMKKSKDLLNFIEDKIFQDVKLSKTRIFDIFLWAKKAEDDIQLTEYFFQRA